MTDDNGYNDNGAIDGNTNLNRLANARAVLAKSLDPGSREKARVLGDRARVLAGKPERSELEGDVLEVAEFLLAHERYAFEMNHIREVYPLKELTPVPCAPSFVSGIINFRGQILSIIDLKTFFELPAGGLTDLNKVIILHSETMEFGVLADEILGVRKVPARRIQPPLPTLTGIRAKYFKGITTDRTVILDGEKLLSDSEIVVRLKAAS